MSLDHLDLPVGGTRSLCHQYSAAIDEAAAGWYRANRETVARPVWREVAARFGMSTHDALRVIPVPNGRRA